jgi:surface polysaccharide O-acyltransferase-like enzyme
MQLLRVVLRNSDTVAHRSKSPRRTLGSLLFQLPFVFCTLSFVLYALSLVLCALYLELGALCLLIYSVAGTAILRRSRHKHKAQSTKLKVQSTICESQIGQNNEQRAR